MKIGMVCYASHGGSGIVATELGAALAARGDEIHFITNDVPVRMDRFSENIFFHRDVPAHTSVIFLPGFMRQVKIGSGKQFFDIFPAGIAIAMILLKVCRQAILEVFGLHQSLLSADENEPVTGGKPSISLLF